MGAKGGKVSVPTKGFGYDDRTFIERLLKRPTRAQKAGAIGGTISRRRDR